MDYRNYKEHKLFRSAYEHSHSEDGLLETTILVAFIIIGLIIFSNLTNFLYIIFVKVNGILG